MKNVFLYSFLLLIGMFFCIGDLHAEEETIDFTNVETGGTGNNWYITWKGISCSITHSNEGLNYTFDESYKSNPDWYNGQKITISAHYGYKLQSVVITCENSNSSTNLKGATIYGATPVRDGLLVTLNASSSDELFTIIPNARIKVKSIVIICQSPTGEIDFVATDGTDYYATFSSDHAVRFQNEITSDKGTSHVTIYAVNVADGKLELIDQATQNGDGTHTSVPANTGVLLKFSGAKDSPLKAFYEYCDISASTLKLVENNMLRPASVEKETDGSYKFYMLAYASAQLDGLGFYWGAQDGGTFVSREGSAYLAVPVTSGAAREGFSFEDDVESIEVPSAESLTATSIYTIDGRKVHGDSIGLSHGLYIVNGKKVMVK